MVLRRFFRVDHEAKCALDIGCGALSSAGDLVDHDVGVREAKAFASCAGSEKNGTHGGRDTNTIRVHIAGQKLHGVINRQSCGDGATGGVDIDVNVLLRVLHLERTEAGR